MAGRGTPARDSAEQRRTDRPDALIKRLGALESRLEAVAVLEKRVAVLAAATVELGAELHARTDRPPGSEPGRQLSELAQRVESIEAEGRERIGKLNAVVSGSDAASTSRRRSVRSRRAPWNAPSGKASPRSVRG